MTKATLQTPETPAAPAGRSIEADEPTIPIHATWYCTDRCTLRCCHCFVPVVPAASRPRELSTEEGKRLIDSLFDAEIFLVAFAGGEPLLREDFFELSAHARSRGLTLQTATNGLHLDDTAVGRMQDVGYQCVQISLDGLTDQTNAWTRGRGSFERTLQAIRTCRRRGLPVVLAFALHQRNLHEAEQLAAFAEREEVLIVKAQPTFFRFRYPDTNDIGTLTGAQLLTLDRVLEQSFAGSPVRLKNIMPASGLDASGARRSLICCTKFESPTIFPDGSLSPCFNGRGIAEGNLACDEFVPTWGAAVKRVVESGRCGCSSQDVDVLRGALSSRRSSERIVA